MNLEQISYAELQKIILEYFEAPERERGSYYVSLVSYLKGEKGLEIPEDDALAVGGHLGRLYQNKKLIKVLVSERVFKEWFGVEWKGEKEKRLCKVYFHKNYRQFVDEITNYQRRDEIKEKTKVGLTSSIEQKVVDYHFFEIVQQVIRQRGFLRDVTLEQLKGMESDIRKQKELLIADVGRICEERLTAIVAEGFRRVDEILGELEEQEKIANQRRKELNQETASNKTSA
jgi:hypothetical protein